MAELKIPFDKNDVKYDAAKKEVSLSIEKFDALVHFIQDLLGRIERAEDTESILDYRLEEMNAENSVLQAVFQKVRKDVGAWLGSEHTIRELANRTGIPYATCHRIVKDRLEKGESVDTGDLMKIEVVVSEDLKKARAEVGEDIVLLSRPGEAETAGDAEKAPGAGMSEKEFTKKLKEGKLVVKVFDTSTGKTQPVEVKDFNLEPARRAGLGLYNLKVKLLRRRP
jgi:chromosome condensin MukBEF ATPase and DNA-binding subunit MukB